VFVLLYITWTEERCMGPGKCTHACTKHWCANTCIYTQETQTQPPTNPCVLWTTRRAGAEGVIINVVTPRCYNYIPHHLFLYVTWYIFSCVKVDLIPRLAPTRHDTSTGNLLMGEVITTQPAQRAQEETY